jgi:hypothetical protein
MKVFIAAAARSIIAPKGGHLKGLQLYELAAPALQAVWQGIRHKSRLRGPESVILGNALGAGATLLEWRQSQHLDQVPQG